MKKKYKFKNLIDDNKKRRKHRIIWGLAVALIVIPCLAVAISALSFTIWAQGVELDKDLLPTASALPTFYDADGEKIDYLVDDYVNPSEIPQNLRNAFVALEDKRFYKHKGYDVIRIGGAIVSNIKSRSIREGASTITQQLVKNTHLSHERTIKRKLNEIAIATKLEKEYSKEEILAMYLSVIYFGNGAYGVKQASKLYFNKEIKDLTLEECATLAGIVKNPKKYSPMSTEEDCINRRNLVLKVMKEQNYISENEYLKSLNTPLTKDKIADSELDEESIIEPYLTKVIDEVCADLGITKYQLNNSGLKIYTNLDRFVQSTLYNESKNTSNFESEDTQNVSVAIDNQNCAVVGYYSSLPYDIKRQTGSVLKPLAVFAPAINENLISLATPICDEEVTFNGYSPKNFGGIYYGDTNVRESIKKSMNSVAVKLMDYLSVTKSGEYLSSFGIKTTKNDLNYALALGATENGISPLNIAEAYMALANRGVHTTANFVRFITLDGKKILSNEKNINTLLYATQNVTGANSADINNIDVNTINGEFNLAISKGTAELITSALIDTVKYGTAKTLSALPFQIASKTGTAQKDENTNSDAWNASYNDRITLIIWHGADEGITERGGGYPTMHSLNIWKALNAKYQFAKEFAPFTDIIDFEIDEYTTQRDRTVVLASQNTPIEYRKRETFSKNNIPNIISSTFEEITAPPIWNVKQQDRSIFISLKTEDIYSYTIYRTDLFGRREIVAFDGKSVENNEFSLHDRPIVGIGVVGYDVICHISCNPTVTIADSKNVYIDNLLYSNQ